VKHNSNNNRTLLLNG